MKKRIITVLIASCAVLFALSGCGGDSTSEETANTPETVAVTYVTSPLNLPSIVEKNQELFSGSLSEIGVEEVSYSEITSGADQTQALASGDIQFLYAVGATSVILSAANGADIKIVSMYSRSPEAFCLYSSDDAISSPEDLLGKTIAGPAGTILHELLVSYLATAGMTIDDVNFVSMGIPDALAALSGGSADVAMLAGAAAYNAEASGLHLVTNGKDLVDGTICCATTGEFYEQHPDVVAALLAAQSEAVGYIESNFDDVVTMATEELDLDEQAVSDMAAYYDFNPEIRESDIASMEKTVDFMLESDMIDNEVDIRSLIAQ
jgi:sulfonate transport system substrate-binding protein